MPGMKKTLIQLPIALYDFIVQHAEENGMFMSELVRDAIMAHHEEDIDEWLERMEAIDNEPIEVPEEDEDGEDEDDGDDDDDDVLDEDDEDQDDDDVDASEEDVD